MYVVCAHRVCVVAHLYHYSLFLKLLDNMKWTVSFFIWFYLKVLSDYVQLPVTMVTLNGQIGANLLIFVGYINTAVMPSAYNLIL